MSPRVSVVLQLLVAGLAAAAGAAAFADGLPALGLPLSLLGAGGLAALLRPRRKAAAAPAPDAWRKILDERCAYFRALDPARREAFLRAVADFIAGHRFTGIGTPATDELRVLAAASAVMLVFHRPGASYPRIAEIVFYPDSFDDSFRHTRSSGSFSGMNADFGAIVFSAPELRRAFARGSDGTHVGLHEFAHALDRTPEQHDGIPSGLSEDLERRLLRIRPEEMRLAAEERSVLDSYGATNEVEFFAVATEAYFQEAAALREGHPELHAILAAYYGPVPEPPPLVPPKPAKRRPAKEG